MTAVLPLLPLVLLSLLLAVVELLAPEDCGVTAALGEALASAVVVEAEGGLASLLVLPPMLLVEAVFVPLSEDEAVAPCLSLCCPHAASAAAATMVQTNLLMLFSLVCFAGWILGSACGARPRVAPHAASSDALVRCSSTEQRRTDQVLFLSLWIALSARCSACFVALPILCSAPRRSAPSLCIDDEAVDCVVPPPSWDDAAKAQPVPASSTTSAKAGMRFMARFSFLRVIRPANAAAAGRAVGPRRMRASQEKGRQ
jgi:hypothetical protein